MSNPNPVPANVEDDPAKPWKAIAAFLAPAILAFLKAILDGPHDAMPGWLWLLLSGLGAGVAVYVVKNPKRLRRNDR